MNTFDYVSIVISGIFYFCLIASCFVIGRKMIKGQWLNLIAGYNTAPREEKDKYDLEGLSKFMALVLYVNGFILIILVPIAYLTIKYHFNWLLYFLIFDLVVFDIYGAVHSNKFKKA